MKVFVILSVFVAYAAAHPYLLPLQVPDTPDVAAAKAQHYAAHVEAAARAGVPPPNPWAYAAVAGLAPGQDTPEVAAAKLQHAQAHAEARARNSILAVVDPWAYAPWVAPGQAIPDTPEVAVAKIQHAQAHAEALARSHQ